LSSVVFPAPKNPAIIVTGIGWDIAINCG
jgi:hypothetical protein